MPKCTKKVLYGALALFLLPMASPNALSETTNAKSNADNLQFRGQMSWLSGLVLLQPDMDAILNPDNNVQKIPQTSAISEIRPDLRLVASRFQLVARPKVRAELNQVTSAGQAADAKGKVNSKVTEAFANWTVSDRLTFAYGRQSYMWGAAEVINASNRIFHETAQQKNFFHEVMGKDIARVNISFGRAFSTVIMTEFQKNTDEQAFTAEEEFANSGLIKVEYNWNGGTDYFGVVLGGREQDTGWIGEYFSWSAPFWDGLSFYADAAHERGSKAWYPEKKSDGIITMEQGLRSSKKTKTLAAGGVKYDFVNGSIWRIEYLLNEAGYTKEQRELFFESLEAPSSPLQPFHTQTNLPRFSASGLEFPGQRYIYTSLHIPDLLSMRDLTLFGRIMRSIVDESINYYASFEYLLNEGGTLSIAGSGDAGAKNTELRSTVTRSMIAAYKYSW